MSITNSVYCFLPPGKPDPYDVPKGNEPRKRVPYNGQKGLTCSYYALKILIDNKATPRCEQSYQRTKEKAISLHRKQMTKLSDDFADSIVLAKHVASKNLNVPRPVIIASLNGAVSRSNDSKVKERILPHVTAFSVQDEIQGFKQFLDMRFAQESVKIHIALLSLFPGFELPQGNPLNQNAILHNTVILSCSQVFQCKNSNWDPRQGVDGLIQQLKEKGPHMINASIGQSFYTVEPKKLSQTIEGRNVYGWAPGAPRKQQENVSHCVVLVGASKNAEGKGHVYFIDPLDPSQPNQPSTQKVYKVSFERLLGVINNIFGLSLALSANYKNTWPFALHM
jgi:hypothetical protein